MSDTDSDATLPLGIVRPMLQSQYHAALATLRDVVEACPDELWLDDRPTNAFWQIALHALFCTHLYLCEDEAAFSLWDASAADVQNPDGIGSADDTDPRPILPEPLAKAKMLAYWTFVDDMVDEAVASFDLHQADSGFPWYRVSKLEHQVINIRHVQHHAAQLADRLRAHGGISTRWIGTRPSRA